MQEHQADPATEAAAAALLHGLPQSAPLTVAQQRFILLANGIEPLPDFVEHPCPSVPATAHCMLGTPVDAATALIHTAAAAGHFDGIAVDAQLARQLNTLAEELGLNARWHSNTLEQMLSTEGDALPQYDSISLAVPYSRMDAASRAQVVEFVRRHTRPSAIFSLGYDCQPGWAVQQGLRHLLHLHDSAGQDLAPEITRHQMASTDAAVDFAFALLSTQPPLLQATPGMLPTLGRLAEAIAQGQQRTAAVDTHAQGLYFADVAHEFASAKLAWGCTSEIARLEENRQRISAQGHTLLEGIGRLVLREQTADLLLGRSYRHDLFMRGVRRVPEIRRVEILLGTRFALLHPPRIAAQLLQDAHTLATAAGHAPNLERCQTIVQNLCKEASLTAPFARLLVDEKSEPALLWLAHIGLIAPCQSEAAQQQARAPSQRLNHWLLAQAASDATCNAATAPVWLASPVTGTAYGVQDRIHALLLHAITLGYDSASTQAAHVSACLTTIGASVSDANGLPLSTAELTTALHPVAEEFAHTELPLVRALGVL